MYEMSAVATEPPLLPDWSTHAAQYLVPPCTERSDGQGPVVDLGLDRSDLFVITLGINHVAEHECLTISVWGSVDGVDWGDEPLVALPDKCYCGVYSTFLDLAKHPQVRYLRVQWNMLRWGNGRSRRHCSAFRVTAQESCR